MYSHLFISTGPSEKKKKNEADLFHQGMFSRSICVIRFVQWLALFN